MINMTQMGKFDLKRIGYINNLGLCAMISDAYKSFNREFNPTKQD